jgi:hypothetical protein
MDETVCYLFNLDLYHPTCIYDIDLSRYKDRLEDASLFVSNIGKKKKKHKKITVIDRKILSPAPS